MGGDAQLDNITKKINTGGFDKAAVLIAQETKQDRCSTFKIVK